MQAAWKLKIEVQVIFSFKWRGIPQKLAVGNVKERGLIQKPVAGNRRGFMTRENLIID